MKKYLLSIFLFMLFICQLFAQDIFAGNEKLDNKDALSFRLLTGVSGNLIYFNEEANGVIVSKNNVPLKSKMKLEFYNVSGHKIANKTIDFDSDKENKILLPRLKGYVEVRYTANINGNVETGVFHYGFIPNNIKIMGGKTSYFGVNTHFNQGRDTYYGKIVKRAGISWIRDGEAFLNDNAIKVAKENGLEYMPCFTGQMRDPAFEYLRKEIAKGKDPNGPWDFSSCLKDLENYVKTYGDYISLYNLMNEPNYFGWTEFGGDHKGGTWLEIFIQWSKQASDIIRKYDKDAKILWDDNPFFYWSDQYIKHGINKEIDYLSSHPYNRKPEDKYENINPLTNQKDIMTISDIYRERFWKRNKETNRNWKPIEGECGYTTFIRDDKWKTGYVPVSYEYQSALLVRMYVMHLSCGVERVFYYDFQNDKTGPGEEHNGWNRNYCEENFGIVFTDGSPKPSICAYANMVNQIEGSKLKGRNENFDNDIYVYNYVNRNGKKSCVCWTENGAWKDVSENSGQHKTINLPTKSKNVNIIDLYGNIKTISSENDKITLYLTEYPVYVVGL